MDEVPQKLSLTITLEFDGRVSVVGPIANKGVCYMLLELGRDAIYQFKPDEQMIAQPGLNAAKFFQRSNL